MVEDQKLIIGKLQLQLSTQYEKEIENLKKETKKLLQSLIVEFKA